MKLLFLTIALGLLSNLIYAQKTPDIQASALSAPANIRIDGKLTEWQSFAAENKRTELFYSVANDNKNIYLVIKSATKESANKILAGGISFTINPEGKKREKEGVTITYPLVNRANRNQGQRQQGGQGRPQGGGMGGFQNRGQQDTKTRDSIANVQRKAQLAGVKEIKISGIKNIADSLISIYNEHGIRAVASVDEKGAFVYELALPIDLLALKPNQEFTYQIKVNGLSNMNFGGGNMGGGRPGGNFGFAGGGQDMMSPTDFWGKYTLLNR